MEQEKSIATVPSFEITPTEFADRFKQLQEFIGQQMKDKEDYGLIPGCGSKPSLFKPGAEKLEFIMGFYHEFTLLDKVNDFEKGFFYFQYKCEVYRRNGGGKVGECIGSANSKENKFIKQDAFSIINSLDKMAQKRAFVGAILSATRASAIFTQDLEDIGEAISTERKVINTNKCMVCSAEITDKVKKFSESTYKKALCMDCQKKVKS